MAIFFTSDTHFQHANIIKYQNRPFTDVVNMDIGLIENWNRVVGPSDEVWHLGDFCWGNFRNADALLECLNGRIHLIWGNHDAENVRKFHRWASSSPYREINIQGTHITLCHYAMRVWNHSNHGSLHFYGHSHGRLQGDRQSVDVGVDYPAWSFGPVSLAQIQEHLKTLPERGNNGTQS